MNEALVERKPMLDVGRVGERIARSRKPEQEFKTIIKERAARPEVELWDLYEAAYDFVRGFTKVRLPDALVEEVFDEIAAEAMRPMKLKPLPPAVATPNGDDRPIIKLTGTELTAQVDATIEALAKLEVFQRGGRIVDSVRAAEPDGSALVSLNGTPIIRHVPIARLREYVGLAARFSVTKLVRDDQCVDVLVDPPKEVVSTLQARGEYLNIRPLVAVVDYPILKPDGTVLQTPGYDYVTGLHYAATLAVDVPEHPTMDQAKAALASILEVVADFPFNDEVAKAGYVAALLTMLARHAINGPTPLFCAEANTAGSGKGKLLDTIGCIVLGQAMPPTPPPPNDEEWSKILSAVGIAGGAVICVDNVKTLLGGAPLELVLTATKYNARILGKNEMTNVPWRTVMFATANNAQYTSDLRRRTILIRLESQLERPEERKDITHTDLLGYCLANRARLLTAALTVLRAYQVAGRPPVELRPMGSYESWSAVVRAPLVWVGMADPAVSQDLLRENGDPERDALGNILTAWHSAFGQKPLTARDVLKAPVLLEAAAEFAHLKNGDTDNGVKLGNAIKRAKGRIVNGLKFVRFVRPDGTKNEGGNEWTVVPT